MMKLHLIAAAAAIFYSAGGINAQCNFCSDTGGITVDGDVNVPNAGDTCGNLEKNAPSLEPGEYYCADITLPAERICCPPEDLEMTLATEPPEEDDEPEGGEGCPVCTNGLTADEDTSLGQGRTCATLIVDAKDEDPDSGTCRAMKGAESICCPEVDPDDPEDAETPDGSGLCSLCPDGFTVDDGEEIDNDGTTCASLAEDASKLTSNNPACLRLQAAETVCCPSEQDPDEPSNPCTFCSSESGDTTILNSDLVVDEEAGRTCAELVFDARTLPDTSETCMAFKRLESTCCPEDADGGEGAENPCPVCAGGITVVEETSLGQGRTCGGLIIDALDVEEDSRQCNLMMSAEEICCPPDVVVDVPCPVCENGLTVDVTTPIGNQGRTCGSLVEDAAATEEDSRQCEAMKGAEQICCPAAASEVEDPCLVCSGGITVDMGTPIGEDEEGTCGELLEEAMEVEALSDDCIVMKMAEATCCPESAPITPDDPCLVCEGGITVEDDTPLFGGGTCAGLVADALETESDSQACTGMKVAEAICCPDAALVVDEPCPICEDGLSVDDETEIANGRTCANLLEDAMSTDSASQTCAAMKAAETICCPAMAAEPCSVCSGGITVDEGVIIGQGRTCGGLMVDAMTVEEDSDLCAAMKYSEPTCCPADETVAPGSTPAPQLATTLSPVIQSIDKGDNFTWTTSAPIVAANATDAPATVAPVSPSPITPSPVLPSPVTPSPVVASEEPTASPQGPGLEFAPGSADKDEPLAPPSGASRLLGIASMGWVGLIIMSMMSTV